MLSVISFSSLCILAKLAYATAKFFLDRHPVERFIYKREITVHLVVALTNKLTKDLFKPQIVD